MTVRKIPTLDSGNLIFDKFMPARLASGAVAPLVASVVPDANLPARLGATTQSATIATAVAPNTKAIDRVTKRGKLARTITLLAGTEDESLAPSNCTVSADSVNYKLGGSAWKMTMAGAVAAYIQMDPISPATAGELTISPSQSICAWVYVPDPSLVTNIQIMLWQDAARTISWVGANNTTAPPQPLVTGWNLLRFHLAVGMPAAWTGTTLSRLRVYATTTAATTVTIGQVWLEAPEKAKMIFVLDRGYRTFINGGGVARCRTLGIPITWAIDVTLLGTNVGGVFEVVTEAEIAQFAAEGDSISFHGWDGAVTSSMTDAQYRADTIKSIKWLGARGYAGRIWRAANVQNLAPDTARAATKGLLLGNAHGSVAQGSYLDTWPPVDYNNIARWNFYGRTFAVVAAHFDTLRRTRGMAVIYNHGIQDAYLQDATPAELENFFQTVTAAMAAGWLEATTFEQLYAESGGTFSNGGGASVARYTDSTGAIVTKNML